MIVGLSLLVANLVVSPLALDGDATTEAGGSGEAIAVVSAISIVGGYLLLFALWRYVFSEKAKVKRREPPD
jgi:Na+-driven multidrug efflux pump